MVRAGRGEVSRQTPHKHRAPAFCNFHLVCTNTDMHWMHVLVLQCMLGHSGWWTVSVCDQLWSVIHLFMQPAVVHECGKLWHSCVYCCGLQKGSFGWVTVWRPCSLEDWDPHWWGQFQLWPSAYQRHQQAPLPDLCWRWHAVSLRSMSTQPDQREQPENWAFPTRGSEVSGPWAGWDSWRC